MAVLLKQCRVDDQKCCSPCAPPPSPVTGARRKFCFKKCTSSSFASNPSNEVDIREYLIASLSRMNVGSSSLKRKQRTEANECSELDKELTPNGKKVKSSIFQQQALFPLITAVNSPLVVDQRQRRELVTLN